MPETGGRATSMGWMGEGQGGVTPPELDLLGTNFKEVQAVLGRCTHIVQHCVFVWSCGPGLPLLPGRTWVMLRPVKCKQNVGGCPFILCFSVHSCGVLMLHGKIRLYLLS